MADTKISALTDGGTLQDTDDIPVVRAGANVRVRIGSTPTNSVGTSRAITAADNETIILCTAAITLTIPAGLSPQPSILVIPPQSGSVTIAVSGGATVNGDTASIAVGWDGNRTGFSILPVGTNAYGCSGSPALGSAAYTAATAYATAAQGTKADGAAQVAGDLGGTPAAPTVPGLAGKQATLVSGTNIKTINGSSLLGSGDLVVSGGGGGGSYEVNTFADLPSPAAATVGRVYTVLGDVCTGGGAVGTQWASDGTFWRPAGVQVVASLTTQVDGASGGSTSEQFLWSPLFVANALRGCRSIRMQSRWIYSAGTNDTKTHRWRVGTAGTSSDTTVSAYVSGSTHRQNIAPGQIVPVSDTQVNRAAQPDFSTPGSPDVAVLSIAASVANATIGNFTSATYISATVQQSAASMTVSLAWAQIIIE